MNKENCFSYIFFLFEKKCIPSNDGNLESIRTFTVRSESHVVYFLLSTLTKVCKVLRGKSTM